MRPNDQTLYKQYSLSSSGYWYDTGNVYAGAPGQTGGIGIASVEAAAFPSIEDIQQSIDDKRNELLNKFYGYVGVDPAELTEEDKMMILRGLIYGIDDNVYFGAAH